MLMLERVIKHIDFAALSLISPSFLSSPLIHRTAAAFSPNAQPAIQTALSAESSDRRAFLGTAAAIGAAAVVTVVVVTAVATAAAAAATAGMAGGAR